MRHHNVYLSLGSNIGDRLSYLQQAVDAIYETVGPVAKLSPVYETKSVGFEGDNFYNAVIEAHTPLPAAKLLYALLDIETGLGRKRDGGSYQSRTIDIDILFCGEQVIPSQNLTIPHPHLHQRRFVLQPLNDIAPELVHPKLQKSITQLLEACTDEGLVKKVPDKLRNPQDACNLSAYNFIAIEGNIGAGKTALARKIAKEFGAKLMLERFADNPFLPEFYRDKKRYAFPLEMSFLADRYQHAQEITSTFTVSDYDISKSLVFAGVTLQEEEFELYRRFFDILHRRIRKPDIYVYLHQTTERLLQNIATRGRAYEQQISAGYLEAIRKGYEKLVVEKKQVDKVVAINLSNLDFVANREDYVKIIKTIAAGFGK